MNWTIVWLEQALNELAAATFSAWGTPVVEQIIQAMVRAENEIQANPTGVGESRTGSARLVVELPLALEIEVHTEQRVTVVTHIRYIPKR